jgi:hypothetical protein
VPLGRVGEAEDITDVIRFLASRQARDPAGQVIVADGGLATSAPSGRAGRRGPPAHFQPARSTTICAATVVLARSPMGRASGLNVPMATRVGLAATLPLTTGHSLLPSAK